MEIKINMFGGTENKGCVEQYDSIPIYRNTLTRTHFILSAMLINLELI